MGFRLYLSVSLPLFIGFDSAAVGYQFEEKSMAPGTGIGYHGCGWHLNAVCPAEYVSDAIVHSGQLESIIHRVREYMIAFLVLETMMIGMFVSLDMLMFYLFLKLLIPMFLIIGVWGGLTPGLCGIQVLLYTLLAQY